MAEFSRPAELTRAEATVISPAMMTRLAAQAAASPDREICGLLFGSVERVTGAQATDNVAADPANSFEIDPVALLAAHKAARTGGPAIVGCYHSHPSGSAVPSARDLAAAEPGRLWLILGGGAARLWLICQNGTIERTLLLEE